MKDLEEMEHFRENKTQFSQYLGCEDNLRRALMTAFGQVGWFTLLSGKGTQGTMMAAFST
eukprot:scaffold4663_cov109-Cylindrotheca_fusiformis.AAC.4